MSVARGRGSEDPGQVWHPRQTPWALMGIVNVTPDSFSDGGRHLASDAAIAHALALVAQGASILDIGGESTRPGALPVPADEERRRVLPVIAGLACARGGGEGGTVRISIDTSKASVAADALTAGATFVNDVTALRGDPEMAAVCADAGCEVCLMHMLGEPRTMQENPRYGDVVDSVKAFLAARIEAATAAGISEERILVDPGIGFGKTLEHNLLLLRRLDEIVQLGPPVVIGTSRKSFLGQITGGSVGDRVTATAASCVIGYLAGAQVFRVHDVGPIRDAIAVAAAIAGATADGIRTDSCAPETG